MTRALVMLLAVIAAGPVVAKDVCLLDASMCESMYAAKHKDIFDKLRNPAKRGPGDALAMSVMYSTFQDAEKKTRRCKRSEKVSLDGFSAYFVMGQGREKRAMMVRGKSECAWVQVK